MGLVPKVAPLNIISNYFQTHFGIWKKNFIYLAVLFEFPHEKNIQDNIQTHFGIWKKDFIYLAVLFEFPHEKNIQDNVDYL